MVRQAHTLPPLATQQGVGKGGDRGREGGREGGRGREEGQWRHGRRKSNVRERKIVDMLGGPHFPPSRP